MRFAVDIDDALFERATQVAEELGTSIDALVEQALRAHLERPHFRLVTFGRDGLQPGVTWDRLGDEDPEVERFLALGDDVPPKHGR